MKEGATFPLEKRGGEGRASWGETKELLNLAIPNKGRLSEKALDILRKVGLKVGGLSDRRLIATVGKKYRILFVRAADIPEFVQNGTVDVGITGLDLIEESGANVERLMPLDFGKCRLVLATHENSDIKTPKDIADGTAVATSFPNLTERYFKGLGKKVKIVPVSGATEVTPHIGVADVIADLTETGSTLVQNHLKEIGMIMESSAMFIANKKALEEKGQKIKELAGALESVTHAAKKRYLMANVPRAKLNEVTALMPGVSGPTIMNLMGSDDMVAIHAVVSEEDVNGIITVLKSLGGTAILVLPIERMVV
jgi:ATP phosphoribosyltransferase